MKRFLSGLLIVPFLASVALAADVRVKRLSGGSSDGTPAAGAAHERGAVRSQPGASRSVSSGGRWNSTDPGHDRDFTRSERVTSRSIGSGDEGGRRDGS